MRNYQECSLVSDDLFSAAELSELALVSDSLRFRLLNHLNAIWLLLICFQLLNYQNAPWFLIVCFVGG